MTITPTDTRLMRAVADLLRVEHELRPERRTGHMTAWAKDLARRMAEECQPEMEVES